MTQNKDKAPEQGGSKSLAKDVYETLFPVKNNPGGDKERTPMATMLAFLNGMLKIEDNLILEYGDNPKAVEDIKTNWQQLNKIKEMAIPLLEAERKMVVQARMTGDELCSTNNANDYFTNNYQQ